MLVVAGRDASDEGEQENCAAHREAMSKQGEAVSQQGEVVSQQSTVPDEVPRGRLAVHPDAFTPARPFGQTCGAARSYRLCFCQSPQLARFEHARVKGPLSQESYNRLQQLKTLLNK